MYIYYYPEGNAYKFKCFSTGKGGSAVELMMHMWKTDYASTINTIMKDYSNYLNGGKAVTKKDFQTPQWIVSDYITREWNANDAKFQQSPYIFALGGPAVFNIGPIIEDRNQMH